MSRRAPHVVDASADAAAIAAWMEGHAVTVLPAQTAVDAGTLERQLDLRLLAVLRGWKKRRSVTAAGADAAAKPPPER